MTNIAVWGAVVLLLVLALAIWRSGGMRPYVVALIDDINPFSADYRVAWAEGFRNMWALRRLFTPQLPSVGDPPAVIDWFLLYDKPLRVGSWARSAVARKAGEPDRSADRVRAAVVKALTECHDSAALQAHLDLTAAMWESTRNMSENPTLPQAARLGASREEWVLRAEIRILGYFLRQRHGIQPR